MKRWTLIVLLLLAGCASGDVEQQLIGKWDFADSDGFSGTYDFKENGTVMVDSLISISGKYAVDDDVLTIDDDNVFQIEKTEYGYLLTDVSDEARYIELHEKE